MSNPDVPGPYWQDPASGDYGSVGYGGTGYGGAGYSGPGYSSGSYSGGRRGSSSGGSASPASAAGGPPPAGRSRGGQEDYRDSYPDGGRQGGRHGGRGNGRDPAPRSSGGEPGIEDPWARQRGGSRRGRPESGADAVSDRRRGDSRPRGDRSAIPAGSADRSPGRRGDRGYPPDAGPASGQVAEDLRDRLGMRASRTGRGAAGPADTGTAGRRGRTRRSDASRNDAGLNIATLNGNGRNGAAANGTGPRSAALDSAGGNGAGRSGAAVGYAADGYGRTLQRGQPGRRGESGWRDDDTQPPGRGRRSGHGDGGRGGGHGGGGPGGPGRSGGGRRGLKAWFLSGDWWRRWTWKKALGVVAVICVGVPVLLLVAFFVTYERTPIPTDTTALATAAPSQVYYSDHRLLASFTDGGLNRQILTAQQIPAVMNDAIIAAEDRNFYTEGGISPTGLLRAAYEDIKGGTIIQGGSTLTEQFVKNYYAGFASANNTDKSANDKLKQILVAIKLAHTKSKSWILTQYLNTVYFGQNAYGVGAAAETYFGKPASKLYPGQAAMLAAMVNQPSYFSTDPHAGAPYDDLVQRWHYVLNNMVRDNALTRARVQLIEQQFPKVRIHLSSSLNGYKGYLMQMVDQELTSTYHLSQTQIDTGGLKITTTFSQSMMNGLYQAVKTDKQMMAADGRPLPNYAYIGAVLERPSDGSIMAVYGGPGYTTNTKLCAEHDCDLNMAEDPKQVGSSFKPYVLATAVSQGMNVQTSKLSGFSPLWIPEGTSMADRLDLSSRTAPTSQMLDQQPYLPFNEADEGSKAPLTPANAAAISSDPAFEDLAHRDGVQQVIDMTKQFGVGQTPFTQTSSNDWTAMNAQFGTSRHNKSQTAGSVAIALGESDLTAVEQSSTFATLADDGVYHTPHVIAKIVHGSGYMPLQVESRTVLTPDQAADVDYALSFDNVPGGTAYPDAAWPGRSVIAKTGTTQTAQDAWFIGAIPQYSLGVTLFTNQQNSSLGPGSETLDILPLLPNNATGGYGGAWPAVIWHTFMTNEFASLAPAALPMTNFNGFDTWDQVDITPNPSPKPSASPSPQPSATATCTPTQGLACVPDGGVTTSPPVSVPTPTMPVTYPTMQPCQPGQPGCQPTSSPPGF